MPIINFTMFADKVISGAKRQTIRKIRKYPIKPGDKLYFYTGLRTKNAKKIGEAVCTEVVPIQMDILPYIFIIAGNKELNFAEIEELARKDGFYPDLFQPARYHMFRFFNKVYGFFF